MISDKWCLSVVWFNMSLLKKKKWGRDFPGSPVVRLHGPTAEGTSLVGQLRSCMPHSAAIKKKKKKREGGKNPYMNSYTGLAKKFIQVFP